MANDQEVNEVLDRVRRIETKITKGFAKLGVTTVEEGDRMGVISIDPPVIELRGLDVPLIDVLTFCRRFRITSITTLMYNRVVVGSVVPGSTPIKESAHVQEAKQPRTIQARVVQSHRSQGDVQAPADGAAAEGSKPTAE